jgi:HK97 family phage major capsid protein
MNAVALREKRARAIEQAKAVLTAVEAEGRTMNEEETRKWDGWMNEADSLKATIERMERMEEEERGLGQSQGRRTTFTQSTFGSDPNSQLRTWLLGQNGREMSFSFSTNSLRAGEDLRAWQNRAQTTTTGAAGGFTVAPEFQGELETALLAFGGARQAARVIRTTTGADLPWPTLNDTASEGRILGENVAANNSDLVFGSVTFGAYKYTSDLIIVSEELLQDSAVDLGAEIGGALGTRIGRVTNRHFTVGTGVAQPQGIVTAAALGVAGSLPAGVTYDDLVNLEHSVNSAYRKGAKFVFSDATLREIKKLKDSEGRPLWVPGLTAGAPDMILGYAYVVNDDMAEMAADAKSILFGDVSKFIIRDAKDVVLRRLDERFAEMHAVGFVAFSRHDSRLIDAGTGPVKYLKNAAA